MAKFTPDRNRVFPFFSILFLLAFSTVEALGENCLSCGDLKLEENAGQWHPNVLYRSLIPGGEFMAEQAGFTYVFYNQDDYTHFQNHAHKYAPGSIASRVKVPEKLRMHALKVFFSGANREAFVTGSGKSADYTNYLLGSNSDEWFGHVHHYDKITYENIYKGIDLQVFSIKESLKYDFILDPGADPEQIQLVYKGADGMLLERGDLHIKTSVNTFVELSPTAWQPYYNQKQPVPCRFELKGNKVTFVFPEGYDPKRKLVIDPQIIFSTYSGSERPNFGYTAAFDSEGNAFGAGSALTIGVQAGDDYPTTAGAFDLTYNGGWSDVGITKYSADGSTRIWSTYLGGDQTELPHSIIANSLDQLVILGTTNSTNFPVSPTAFDNAFNPGGDSLELRNGLGVQYIDGSDIFVSVLEKDGSGLVGSTYLGGSDVDGLNYDPPSHSITPRTDSNFLWYNYADQIRGEVEVDGQNNIYIASVTRSNDFPMAGAGFDQIHNGNQDGVIAKLNSTVSTLIWSTYYGGSQDDALYSIAIDSAMNVIAAGGTESNNLPVSGTGSYDATFNGGNTDGIVVKISANGSQQLGATYYGLGSYDQAYFVELDRDENIYLMGQVQNSGAGFIFNSGYNIPNGGQYVVAFTPDLSTRIWSTTVGSGDGLPDISPTAFLVDVCNSIYLGGWGGALNGFPTQGRNPSSSTAGLLLNLNGDAYQTTTDNDDFYFMVLDLNANNVFYDTYFGDPTDNDHVDGGTCRFDKKAIIYQSVCACNPARTGVPIEPSPTSVVSSMSGVPTSNGVNRCNQVILKFDIGLPSLIADFDLTQDSEVLCFGDSVLIRNTTQVVDSTNVTWFWDFGDSTFSTLKDPPLKWYPSGGIFEVKLVVRDDSACNSIDSTTRTYIVLSGRRSRLPDAFFCIVNGTQIGIPPIGGDSVTFTWSPTTGLSDTSITNPIANPTQTTRYMLIVNNGTCVDTFDQTVFVLDGSRDTLPTVITCADAPIQIGLNNPDPTKSYQWVPDTYLSSDVIGNPVSTPDTSILYTLFVQDGSCEDTFTQQVVAIQDSIEALPVPGVPCLGDTVSLNASNNNPFNPLSWQWTPSDLIVGSDTVPGTSGIVSGSSNTFVVTATNEFGCNFSDTVDFGGSDIDIDIVTPAPTICLGDTVQLQVIDNIGTDTLSYDWQPAAQVIDGQDSSTVTVVPINSQVFTVTVTNQLGCTEQDTIEIVALTNASDTLPNDTLCAFQGSVQIGIQLNNDTAIDYLWKPGDFLSDSTDPTPIASPPVPTTYVLMAQLSDCADTFKQFVYAIVDSAEIFPDSSICLGDTIQLNASTSLSFYSVTYNWEPADSIIGPNNIADPLASPRDSATFIVGIVNSFGCIYFDTVEISPIVVNFDLGPTDNVCIGDTLTLTAVNLIPEDSLTYNWSPTGFVVGGQGDSVVQVVPDTTGYIYLTATNAIGCSASDSTFVLAFAGATAELDTAFSCFGDSVQIGLFLPPDPGVTYRWVPGIWLSYSTISQPYSVPLGDTTYQLIIGNAECADTFDQRVETYKNGLEIIGDRDICTTDTASFTVLPDSAGEYSYRWNPDSVIVSGVDSLEVFVQAGDTFLLSATITDTNGCEFTDSATINVILQGPNVSLFAIPSEIKKGQRSLLDATVTENTAAAGLDPNVVYEPVAFFEDTVLSDPFDRVSRPDTSITYTISTKDGFGCESKDTARILILQEPCDETTVYIPNAFTPNSDNKNDLFRVRSNNITEMKLTVFDRWGQQMIVLNSPDESWDGTFKGKPLDPAVFAYILEVLCDGNQRSIIQGNVTLIR